MQASDIDNSEDTSIVAEPLFDEGFIRACTDKVKSYNQSSDRGILHSFYTAVSDARRIPELAPKLHEMKTAEQCFELLVLLAQRERAIKAPGFCDMSSDLRRSICEGLKEKNNGVFDELSNLAKSKHQECGQNRNMLESDAIDSRKSTYKGPSLEKISAVEAAVQTVQNTNLIAPSK